MSYSIENLDVYRKAVVTGTRLCRLAGKVAEKGSPELGAELRARAVSIVSGLAGGLGFWERDFKTRNFTAAKCSVLELLPLLEILGGLGLVAKDEQALLAEEFRDLAKMISGLLRGSKRRESQEGNGEKEPAAVGERSIVYH